MSLMDDGKFEEDFQDEAGNEEETRTNEVDSSSDSLFWSVLESELDVDIPSYVRNIMRLCHLDKPLSFRCVRDDTIAEVESFARKDMIYQLMGVEVSLEDYYGPFHKMPHKFRFAIGDRLLIKQLVTCAKSKSDEFWRRALTTGRRARAIATTAAADISDGHLLQQQQQRDDAGGASSELELDDEEDQLQRNEPLDLDRERKKLAEMVRSSLLKEDFGQGVDPKQLIARVKVRVTVKTAEEHGLQRDLVTGFIKCVFCPTRLMIRKQSFGARKPRWVISNYRRHIRFHTDGKLKRPSPSDFAQCKSEFYLVNCDAVADEQTDDQTNATQQHDHEDQR